MALLAPERTGTVARRRIVSAPWAEGLYEFPSKYDYKLAYGGRGSSKSLRDDTPIPTPSGWTPIGDLAVGDVVFGADGEPVTVVGVFPQGEQPEWRVGFAFADPLFCSADHLWRATDHLWRKARNRRGESYDGWATELPVRATADLAGEVLYGQRGDRNLSVPLGGALGLPDADLATPPYLLGLWLGDGISSGPDLTCLPADGEHYRARLATLGEVLHEASPSTAADSAPRYPVSKTLGTNRSRAEGFAGRLRSAGLLNNKHVPAAYLRGSAAQRLDLLAGLMDTDGTVTADSRSAVFTSMLERLARSARELLSTLGVRSSLRTSAVRVGGRYYGTQWSVEFRPFPGCVTLPRKAERIRPLGGQANRGLHRMVTAIEPTGGTAPMTCIRVDAPDRMFLAGPQMIPTHNTYEISRALTVLAHNRPLRIGIAREHLKSIAESAKPELEERIREFRLLRPDCFRVSATNIDHVNGSHFFFVGLSNVSEEDIKGLAMVDILWIEEAHRMSHSSWELVDPTVRKEGAEIWGSFNPKYRTDAIWKFTESTKNDPRVWQRFVTFVDNPFFTARNERSRVRDKESNPERYSHIWDGQPDDASAKRKVLPFNLLQVCVDSYHLRPIRGAIIHSGLDVADTGADWNAYTMRSGPELFFFQRWRGSLTYTTSDTARRRAAAIAEAEGAEAVYYDIGGPGAGIRGPMLETDPTFFVQGCHFGGKVNGPTKQFTRGSKPKTNEQYFFNWAAQAGWNLRLRAEMTQRLVGGEPVDPHDCLFISPDLPNLQDVLGEMAQPEWNDDTGKLRVDKQPREPGEAKPPSPDAYDSAVMAFSDDFRRGLRNPLPLED